MFFCYRKRWELIGQEQRKEWQDIGHEGGWSQGNKRASGTWCRWKEQMKKELTTNSGFWTKVLIPANPTWTLKASRWRKGNICTQWIENRSFFFYVPITDLDSWSQAAVLPPKQCPAHLPLPGYVERVITIPRSLVALCRLLTLKTDKTNKLQEILHKNWLQIFWTIRVNIFTATGSTVVCKKMPTCFLGWFTTVQPYSETQQCQMTSS